MAVSGLVVQARVPPGLVAEGQGDRVGAVVTMLPDASSMLTAGWSSRSQPSAPPPGWVLKTSWVAAPAVMVNECWSRR